MTEYIITPKELGERKLQVVSTFKNMCECGKHEALINVLYDQEFKTILHLFCETTEEYIWATNNNEGMDKRQNESL